MKINKSKLARDMGVDRRTIDKYLNGLIKKVSKLINPIPKMNRRIKS